MSQSDSICFADGHGRCLRPGSSVTPGARFRNLGGNSRQNVPVKADVYYNGVTTSPRSPARHSRTRQRSSAPHWWPSRRSPQSWLSQTGVYEVRIYPKLSTDQDPGNDTAKKVFYISRPNDMMPYAILQPFSNVAPLFTQVSGGRRRADRDPVPEHRYQPADERTRRLSDLRCYWQQRSPEHRRWSMAHGVRSASVT